MLKKMLLILLFNISIFYEKVLEVTSDNFITNIEKQSYSFILFYIEGEHNDRILTLFEQIRKNFFINLELKFLKIDGKKNEKISTEWEVNEFPTLILYKTFLEERVYYNRKLNKQEIIKFLKKEIFDLDDESQINQITYLDQLNHRNITKHKNVVFFIGDKDKFKHEYKITRRAVKSLGKRYFIIYSNSTVVNNHYNVSKNRFELFYLRHQNQIKNSGLFITKIDLEYINKISVSNLENLIIGYHHTPFIRLNDVIIEKIFSAKYKILLLVFNNSTTNSSIWTDNLSFFANKHRGDLWIITSFIEDSEVKEIFKYIEIESFPGAVIFSGINNKTQDINKYILNTTLHLESIEKTLEKFVNDWKENKIINHLRSQKLDLINFNSYNNVHKIVGKFLVNFTKLHYFTVIIFLNDKMINADLKRNRFNRIALNLKGIKEIKFGEIDPYYNEIEIITMKYYPGLAIFSNKDNISPSEYESISFKTLDILKFIESHTGFHDLLNSFSEIERNLLINEEDISYEIEEDREESNKVSDLVHDDL